MDINSFDQIHSTEDNLETLDRCPLCHTKDRQLLFSGLRDWICGYPGEWTYWRCRQCSCVYLDPRPDRVSILYAYENYPTHFTPKPHKQKTTIRAALKNGYLHSKYGYDFAPQNPLGRYLLYLLPPFLRHEWDCFARHLPRPKTGHNLLLDIGCGNGAFLLQAKRAGWDARGCDFDPKVVDIARAQGLSVQLGGPEAQPEATFDVVTLSHVIEHVHEPVNYLKECFRILKPGGMLWLATPNLDSLGFHVFKENWRHFHPEHLVLFTHKSIKYALKCSGAVDISFKRLGYHFYYDLASILEYRKGRWTNQAKLPSWLMPLVIAIEFFNTLFPKFQEEIVLTCGKLTAKKRS